ncbi:hypothetical protein J2795_002664 [Chryseobacterium bernardetii]|uniref:Uncharacterized protein n=2 Tax=Chryseobacterium TaxID=59732 RepID=A0A543EB53_9FLAO|nr:MULTISPECIES: hypothetical protein [Chryseobacterium]MDR6371549.1 hypothetical protein [Chryseobacterium vietnamense]MDR6441946.1 hypothetical protein [Chryseobacterium bernardetii]TQM18824.1 hypothetical protein FB551_3217 [Chryseobacterium aquifrigidense]
MIKLYTFISEQELLEIEKGKFKKFLACFPLHFYIKKIPESTGKHLQFLVQFDTEKEKISHLTASDEEQLVIENTEDLDKMNSLIEDKIKIIGIAGKNLNISQESVRILEKEKRFFEFRLKTYLHTNNREIIPYDYFEKQIDYENGTSESTEEEISIQYYDEKRSKINTVEEAVDFLINEELNEDNINGIRNQSLALKFDELGGLFGLGMYLRNIFIYPNKNENFLQHLKTYDPQYLVNRGEFGEGIIEDLLWRKLNDKLITDESKNKIAELKKEQYEEDSFWNNYIKEQLLSYSLDDEVIRLYLELEDKKDAIDEDFEHSYYEQKRILAGISENERSVYDQIAQDYFTIRNLIEKLRHKP